MKKHRTKSIIDELQKQGAVAAGVAEAASLKREQEYVSNWIKEGCNGNMGYIQTRSDSRSDPWNILEGTKSVICALFNYNYGEPTAGHYVFSRYSSGKDYHRVIVQRLNHVAEFMQKLTGEQIKTKVQVDSSPLHEKIWTMKAGLGWQGKQTILINPEFGSFNFIGIILTDLELEHSAIGKDRCGNCTACIDACPTKAITAPYQLDARKCISYHTIENEEEIPENIARNLNGRFFGCDICQDACPWNSKAKCKPLEEFRPNPELIKMTDMDWENLDEEKFNMLFKDTAAARTGFCGMQKNIKAAAYR